jgi:UDP-4-amino-4,6-dideoxy-L-N-acetyl-beta-L-altrosamine transaminase
VKYPYAKHYVTKEDEDAVLQAMRSSFITRGPAVEGFEAALCENTGARFAICFANASLALWACAQAVNASEKDLAIVPANTFIATASAVMNQGTRLMIADVDPHTGNMDLDSFEKKLADLPTGRRLLLPVHFTGQALDMNRLSGMALGWNDVIIEDAAHAIGSYYPSGEKVGSCVYSDMTVFSFHACKNITSAEGGAVMTNDETLYQKLRHIRDSGISRNPFPYSYDVTEMAVNAHMNDLQASLCHSQLKRLDLLQQQKTSLLERYQDHLKEKLVSIPSKHTHYHLCVAHLTKNNGCITREKLMLELLQKEIGTQIHYPPLYDLSVIKKYPRWQERLQPQSYWPGMQTYRQHAISLPLYPGLKPENVDEICRVIAKAIKER